ncbi:sugar phosphate isomerase/epimerase family protein [Rariglobus hedericola]|uniref:Sugar phosphate isomerase/epimerase n=1 Tax=Rariglobus hedericola TaxID=2597822 RepID=A0A556QRN1_9BACT|nr:sugar phosphate isomerase/epimerase family protein [Rariglobus hedericola]TSJ79283.1 sugar phosphate isomerase/epimerase [Rariglobus hedericola]
MLYSFMSFSSTQLNLTDTLALAKRLGYDAIEPRPGWDHRHGIELSTTPSERAAIRRQITDSGIAVACLAPGLRFANPATASQQLAEASAYIDLAADIGAPLLRVFGGELGAGIDRDTAIVNVADALRSLVPQARARGVKICMETHDAWTNPDHVAAVLERVNDPHVRAVWDVMHPLRASGWSIRDAFDRLRPWIEHVHIHDGTFEKSKLEFAPIGRGLYDIPAVFACLAEMNYTGYLSGEWINCDDTIDLATELAAMKSLESAARA